jgi:hypothetical protein
MRSIHKTPQQFEVGDGYILNTQLSNIYLKELGILDDRLEVKCDKIGKYHQIQNFVNVIDRNLERTNLLTKNQLTIYDMAAGNGFTTFAFYDYFNNVLKIPATVVGVENNEITVSETLPIIEKMKLSNLVFINSTVEEIKINEYDILVSLHACDTATDDAIFQGVKSGAEIIAVAPCCQDELKSQIKSPDIEVGMLKNKVYLDSLAKNITDSLR